jgi:hypothetical protein
MLSSQRIFKVMTSWGKQHATIGQIFGGLAEKQPANRASVSAKATKNSKSALSSIINCLFQLSDNQAYFTSKMRKMVDCQAEVQI